MKKILLYGDSIMRGVIYDQARHAHILCQNSKLPRLCSMGFDVKNYSRMGATIDTCHTMLDRTIDECTDALILLEYGGNDCDHNWADISAHPEGCHYPNTPEAIFEKRYEEAIVKAKSHGGTVVLTTLVPVNSDMYLKWITRNNSYANVLGWLGSSSMLHRWQERYNRIIEKLSVKLKVPLLDIRDKFLSAHNYDDLMCTDGIHPSNEGHELIEDMLCNFFALCKGKNTETA